MTPVGDNRFVRCLEGATQLFFIDIIGAVVTLAAVMQQQVFVPERAKWGVYVNRGVWRKSCSLLKISNKMKKISYEPPQSVHMLLTFGR